MSTVLIIASLVVAYGLGLWSGFKAVRSREVRQKLARDIAGDLLDMGLDEHIATSLRKERV